MLADRILRLADDEDRSGHAAIARAFQLFVLMHVAVRTALWAGRGDTYVEGRLAMAGVLVICAAVAALDAPRARAAALIAMLVLALKLGASFPATSNHFFIEFLCVGLLALCDVENVEERALLLAGARWLTVIVLFYSGVQKLWHGAYFDAQFLGYSIGQRASFAWLFGWVVPSEEIARLQALHPPALDSGPYSIRSPFAVAISNAVYLFEIIAPILLIARRTRPYAAVAALSFVAAIEIGALELLFGALFVNLLLLFFTRAVNQALLPAFAALFTMLLASRIGVLPRFWFN
ncbi:MAG: hypothetical protein AB7V27_01095 [Candidatus Binatia bacterium]